MIAGGQHIDTAIIELAAQPLGQPITAGRVLGIDDDKIEGEVAAQFRDVSFDRIAPRPPHHIAAKQDIHNRRTEFPPSELALRAEPPRPSACNSLVARRSRWAPYIEATTPTGTAPKR